MKPKAASFQPQRELFRIELGVLVDPTHPLVKLGRQIDWALFEEELGKTYDPKVGAPGVPTRLMVALHYLKYQHDLSDEWVVEQWVENPYWQHFSGANFLNTNCQLIPPA